MTKAFDKISGGLADTIDYAQDNTTKTSIVTGAGGEGHARRDETKSKEIATKLHAHHAIVLDWGQHRRSPDALTWTLLVMVDADPKEALV